MNLGDPGRKALGILLAVLLGVTGGAEALPAASVTQGDIETLRKAVQSDPASRSARRNLSAALTEYSRQPPVSRDGRERLSLLREAVNADAENGPAWMEIGDLLYLGQSDFNGALEAWKKALPLAPPDYRRPLVDRISRAETDLRLERTHQSLDSARFQIRYAPGFNPEEAARILAYVEARYGELSASLGIQPRPLTLIIYPDGAFNRVTGGHETVLGLYDGRIRIGEKEIGGPLEGVILSHELAHAFLQHAYGNQLPVWIQEGFAQAWEPPRAFSEDEKAQEAALRDGTGWVPLKWLDRRFLQPSSEEDVSKAYLQARQAVAALIERSGGQEFKAFLERLSRGEELKPAFEKSFKGVSWNSAEHGRFQN